MRRPHLVFCIAWTGVVAGCASFRSGSHDAPETGAPPLADAAGEATTLAIDGGGSSGSTYGAAQAALAQRRFPGPTTTQGSTGTCTTSRFVWRESSGAFHSWTAATQTQIDYGFTGPTQTLMVPSDAYVGVYSSNYATVDVYDATTANSMVASLPYAFNFVATDSGIVRLDQRVNNMALSGTMVRLWVAAGNTTTQISSVLPTQQPPSSFGKSQVIIPGGVNVPYPLYITDVGTMMTTSVTFDGAIAIYNTLPTTSGLVVSYARSGPTPEIRLYQNDTDSMRVEVGDELANIPPLFSDSPPREHAFIAHIAASGTNLIYASAFGIFAFGLGDGSLRAVQLGPNKTTYVPDILCVIESPRTLIYRVQGDSVGQIWAVPLDGLLP
jgi:hypothetical protein